MKKLLKRISKVADSTAQKVRGEKRKKKPVPAGHVPVHVGEEKERFVVSAESLNHPAFIKLLNKSEQEYGYDQKGVLHIPCRVVLFRLVLDTLRHGASGSANLVLDLLDADCS